MPALIIILHVEDDSDDVELLQEAFDNNDLSVSIEVLKQGDVVLPWLESGKMLPNVIVMDLNLPKLHGREILGRIKSHPKFKSIPLVVLTTSSSQTDLDYCLKLGADEFITKPSTVEGFNRTVAIIMDVVQKSKDRL